MVKSQADPIKQYLLNISRYPLLSSEEEIELARRVQANDAQAKKRMIEANLKLVVHIAKKHQNRGLDFLDLIQEGNLGLIKAVEKFDPSQGCRFNTYAVYHIQSKVLAAIYNKSRSVRLPSNITEQQRKLRKAYRGLTAFLERPPTLQELAYHLELPVAKIKQLIQLAQSTLSLDQPIAEDSSITLGASIEGAYTPETNLNEDQRREQIQHLLSHLDERQQTVVAARYGLLGDEPLSLAQISELIGVSKTRARVIVEKAMQHLQQQVKQPIPS